ncbi:MAG: peptide-methionine (S)-S-oxide reductase [Bacillota bacterium]
MEEVYFAGGCLWGVQAFIKTIKGVVSTQAGRANGTTNSIETTYDGYAECVKTVFDPNEISIYELMDFFFEIIDPYSMNKQGIDVGKKYRTGVYSKNPHHLKEARKYIDDRKDKDKIVVEILPLENYVKSADEHQDRLDYFPDDYCHIPKRLLEKYKSSK